MPLLQLISMSKCDEKQAICGDSIESFWKPKDKQYMLSTQNYNSFDFNLDTVTVSRNGDLIGDCYLHITGISKISYKSIYDIITSVSFEIGGQIIEDYNGQALRMMATFDKKAIASIQGNVAVVPLRLCISETKLPLICLRFHEVKIKVILKHKELIKKLFINYIYLDTDERRLLSNNPQKYNISQKSTMCVVNTNNEIVKIDLSAFLKGSVRDMIVLIKQKVNTYNDNIIQTESFTTAAQKFACMLPEMMEIDADPLLNIKFIYDQHVISNLDSIMSRHVIPRQLYNIENNTEHVYFVPFDNTPLANSCTAFFNFQKAKKVGLELELIPGSYEIHIMARTFNILHTSSGMATLEFNS